jgi:hypothetical protein
MTRELFDRALLVGHHRPRRLRARSEQALQPIPEAAAARQILPARSGRAGRLGTEGGTIAIAVAVTAAAIAPVTALAAISALVPVAALVARAPAAARYGV